MSITALTSLLDICVVVMMALHVIDVIAESGFDNPLDQISTYGIALAYSWAIYRIATLWVSV